MEILKVVLLGLGTVFVGLSFIILLIELMHAILKNSDKKKVKEEPVKIPEKTEQKESIPHGDLVACIAAAIAEELGTDVSAIRIHSIKKI